MRISALSRDRLDDVCELERLCFSTPWSKEALFEELDNPLAVFLTAQSEGKTVGYIGCHFVCGEGFMTNLAVHPDFRRRGIAKALLSELKVKALELGGETIKLEVRKSNLPAIALYTSLGYTVDGERPDFYRKPTENAVLMTLRV